MNGSGEVVDHRRSHVGSALVRLLEAHGVDTVFGLPGGQTQALYDAVALSEGRVRHVVVRDERTAAYAADAYARLTGRVGVCDSTVGPGTAKLPSGLGEALNSSVPVLAIVSELGLATEHQRYRGATSQSIDQEAMLAPVTKWVGTVRRAEDLDRVVRRAFREATTGRPGPVAVIIPVDVFDGEGVSGAGDPHAARFGSFPSLRPLPDPADVSRIVELLTNAERPLVVLGGGARLSRADAATRLVERLPVATTLSGKGCIDESAPLAAGTIGTLGSTSANQLVQDADVLLVVGSKLGSAGTSGYRWPTAEHRVAVIDVDPVELGRDQPVDALCLADAALGLDAVVEALEAKDVRATEAWTARVSAAIDGWRRQKADERDAEDPEGAIVPQRVMAGLQELLAPSDVVVADASLSSGWVGCYLDVGPAGPTTLLPRGFAGLGWAIPAAIGAATAHDGRVIAVMGDGAAPYAIGELSTLLAEGLDVKLIVLNNGSYGWIRWYRRVAYGRGFEHPDTPPTDFAKVAAAYGLASMRCDDDASVDDTLAALLAADGPALAEFTTAMWQTPIAGHRRALESDTAAGYGG